MPKSLEVVSIEVELLRKLVSDELDRRVAAIDDIIMAQYQVRSDRHTQDAIAAIKVAILSLVRSPLAELERKLAVEPVKVVDKPAEVAV